MNYLFYTTNDLDFVHIFIEHITHFSCIDNEKSKIFLLSGICVEVKRNHIDIRKDIEARTKKK